MRVCPRCNTQLGQGDVLRMYWYEPRQWYVLSHDKPGGRAYCGIAGFQLEDDYFIRRTRVDATRYPVALFEVTPPPKTPT